MKRLWLDLGDVGIFHEGGGPLERWQDHGLGLLRTILHQAQVSTDLASVRDVSDLEQLRDRFAGYDMLLMNVRSYTFPIARRAAEIFKEARPQGLVVTGGMHATVAMDEMEAVAEFDRICRGAGEGVIVDLVREPQTFPRVVEGRAAASMNDWPRIDRELWPNPGRDDFPWPLEPQCGWGPAPVATVITSRVCPWQCAFCNEASFIANMGRRSPEDVIEELNDLDERYGPIGSVVLHDSMFFQQPSWLERWLEAYPRLANQTWPYWAAARSDTVRRWPELFEALLRETNWRTVSIGFESGSDRVLRLLNKECTAEDNAFTIDLLNEIADDLKSAGREPPQFWANVMFGIPGETREDAFATVRMIRRMRYRQLSPSFYAPYPGSALGYQLMAEGSSLLDKQNYHRYPSDEKVRGVDYPFYRDLIEGKIEVDDVASPDAGLGASALQSETDTRASRFFLFDLVGGRCRLAYGRDASEALEILRDRLDDARFRQILPDRFVEVKQREIPQYVDRLG